MIIKSKPLSPFFFRLYALTVGIAFKRFIREVKINPVPIKPDHSYILMCNHYGFMDGFAAAVLCRRAIWGEGKMRKLYYMSVKAQMEKNKWMRYLGSFSVDPGKKSIMESFDFAAEVLSQPGNLIVYYPQARLETNHITHIHFESGLKAIIPRIQGKCQILWSSNIMDYFEGIMPTLTYNMLDCGTAEDFDFETVKAKVNEFHLACLNDNVRFTKQPIQ